MPQEVPDRHWAKVAADIFYYKGRDYLLVVDYFSKYPEVLAMKEMFARHGIPERIIAEVMGKGVYNLSRRGTVLKKSFHSKRLRKYKRTGMMSPPSFKTYSI